MRKEKETRSGEQRGGDKEMRVNQKKTAMMIENTEKANRRGAKGRRDEKKEQK